MATPTRNLVHKTILKRLQLEDNIKKYSLDHHVLIEVKDNVIAKFRSLDAKLIVVENDPNLLKTVLEVSRKIKLLNPSMGPLDTFKVIFEGKLRFNAYFFAEVVEEGNLMYSKDSTRLAILQKMDDKKFSMCVGVGDYSK